MNNYLFIGGISLPSLLILFAGPLTCNVFFFLSELRNKIDVTYSRQVIGRVVRLNCFVLCNLKINFNFVLI